jgi:hypothetical protein
MVRRLFLSRFAQLAALPFASAGSSPGGQAAHKPSRRETHSDLRVWRVLSCQRCDGSGPESLWSEVWQPNNICVAD